MILFQNNYFDNYLKCLQNESICLGIDSEKRQSFSERICDDLCPHILQYLSLEDKLRLECVSQQFQRCIITSQRVINISLDFKGDHIYWLIVLESLLKKFPNINEVRNTDVPNFKSHYNKVIELIIKYCNKLTHFNFRFDFLSEENLQNILLKYSLNFDSVYFQYSEYSQYLPDFAERFQQLFSSIKESNIKKLMSFNQLPELISIKFNRLTTFELYDIVCDLDKLKIFFEANKSIKYLKFNYTGYKHVDYFKRFLRLTSLLPNLIHLRFKTINFGFNEEVISEEITQLALNCKHLKSIECCIVLRMSKFTTIRELLTPLRQFKQLRRLELYFFGDDFMMNPGSSHQKLRKTLDLFDSFEAFEGFEDLTHLTVCLKVPKNYSKPFPESILKDIDINLPKLQYLSLYFDLKASEWTADILCRLTRLQTLELNMRDFDLLYDYSIEPNFVSELQPKCKKTQKCKVGSCGECLECRL